MSARDEDALAAEAPMDGARLRQLRGERALSPRNLTDQAGLYLRKVWRAMRWILVSLAILTACTASTLGILSMGDLIE